MSSKPSTEVLIVGAGPVGLAAAYSLKILGVNVRIIDKRAAGDFSTIQARAISLSCRAIEFLESVGLKQRFINEGHICRGISWNIGDKEYKKKDFTPLDDIDTEVPYFLHLPQWKMETIITEALNELGVNIEWETKFLEIKNSPIEISTTVLKNGEKNEITSSYLLSCDGSRGTVREAVGGKIVVGVESFINFRQVDVKFPAFKGDISNRSLFFLKDKIVSILPIYSDYQRIIVFQLKDNVTSEMNLEFFEKILNEAGYQGNNLKDPKWFAEFEPISGLSEKFQFGNVFLLGDAAHPISAITGQGVNTGFQDVYNFCWKLGFVLHKKESPELLLSYHDERHHAGKQLVDRASRLSYFFRDYMKGGFSKFRAKRQLSKEFFMMNYLIEQSQLKIHYNRSSILQDIEETKGKELTNLIPGMRFPNFQVASSARREAIYKYASYDRYLLLLFSGENSHHIIHEMQAFKTLMESKYPTLIKVICIIDSTLSPSGFNFNQGWPEYVCCDVEQAHKKLGIVNPCYLLIRPDTYFARAGSLKENDLKLLVIT